MFQIELKIIDMNLNSYVVAIQWKSRHWIL